MSLVPSNPILHMHNIATGLMGAFFIAEYDNAPSEAGQSKPRCKLPLCFSGPHTRNKTFHSNPNRASGGCSATRLSEHPSWVAYVAQSVALALRWPQTYYLYWRFCGRRHHSWQVEWFFRRRRRLSSERSNDFKRTARGTLVVRVCLILRCSQFCLT